MAWRLVRRAIRLLVVPLGLSIATPTPAQQQDEARTLTDGAIKHYREGRYTEAVSLAQRALELDEKSKGPNHSIVAQDLNNLALLYEAQGRLFEAEPLYKRALSIVEKTVSPNHWMVAKALNNLAGLYRARGRYQEAEPLYKRSLAIDEIAMGVHHPEVAADLNNLAGLYRVQRRYGDAEPLYKRSIAILEKAQGPNSPGVALELNNLGLLYQEQHRYSEAEPLHKRGLAIDETELGPDHPDVATDLNNLALLYQRQARYSDAKPLYQRSLSIRIKKLGQEHPSVSLSLYNLAWLEAAQHSWGEAAEDWRRAYSLLQRQAGRTLGATANGSSGEESRQNARYFIGLIKLANLLAAAEPGGQAEKVAVTFEMAQWALTSEAGVVLAQMSARGASRSPDLAKLVREQQDLLAQWRIKEKSLISAWSQPTASRNATTEQALAEAIAAIDARRTEIDNLLAKSFPEYNALASPKPAAVTTVQSSLHDDEALVLLLDTTDWAGLAPEETFVWLVTNKNVRWVRSNLGTKALQERVAALRCGLDRDGEWLWSNERQRWLGRKPACEALQPEGLADGEPLPFKSAIAHELYKGLFGEVEDLIAVKHLLIVPSGALTSLPFQVLLTKPPAGDQSYQTLSWLVRDHALTVLPTAPSLIALRRNAGHSAASEPFVGFGNPVLAGQCGPVLIPDTCPDLDDRNFEAQASQSSTVGAPRAVAEYFRDGLADVEALRQACPLPDTAHELECVAKSLGAPPSSLVLGKDMTETAVKKMPLHHYRIIHFATHGLLAGETAIFALNRAEPALLFTPPNKASEEDDGLLTASEIVGLKLDADWVVMSACNTAGGEKPGAEALSGLAKAFFYAGARALLVSHWPVDTNAATMLTSGTFAALRKDKTIGKSEAFRRAMLDLIDASRFPRMAHPSVWAPFVVVGEGGAGQ
jgi:CHAT domain-containing protein/tetratricopeptide (TPR) repeat protein